MKKRYIIWIVFLCVIHICLIDSETVFAKRNQENEFEYILENGQAVLTNYTGNEKSVTIPKEIDGYTVNRTQNTFYKNERIKKVKFEEGITSIGENTFYGCQNLKTVELPETVCYLGEYAFAYSGIEELDIPKSTTSIGEGCFAWCEELFYISSHADKLYIESFAFDNSSIRVMQVESTPVCYENVFTNGILLMEPNSFFDLFMRNRVLGEILLLLGQGGTNTVICITLGIAIVVIAGALGIRILFLKAIGKNNMEKYKKYSKGYKEWIMKEKSFSYSYMDEKSFQRDKIISFMLFVISSAIILYVLLFSATMILQNNSFASITRAYISMLLAMIICVVLILAICIGLVIIKTIISEKWYQKNRLHIRIRRIKERRK